MSLTAIEQLDLDIKRSKESIRLGEAVERLRRNRDFKEVIIEGFLKEEAVRLVHLKADPAMQTPARQESILRQIDAIGILSGYLTEVLRQAENSRRALEDQEQAREEMAREELE